MKKIILSACILLSFSVRSQIKALTEDGKEVVLLENKTWKFVNESDEKTLETITTNDELFEKTKESTFIVKSKNVDGGFYYNPKKWKIVKAPESSTFVEYAFNNLSNSTVYALFGSEIMPVQTLKNLKDILIPIIQRNSDYFKLKKSEYRTVNGIKVLHVEYSANVKGLDFEYIANLYLTSGGYCSVSTHTYANQFEANKNEMENFVNGIVKAEKRGTDVVEIMTSPPPPMAPKKSK
ncbi:MULTISPECIES: hypothetical protein [unclassified Chryseobacterium]|uniref:hypothetical protein n=1 Tax=unclassified Chryseobacterium TaxID=2593645 RepID=UPI0011593D00|nr:hypothetical protein [Chryseobacterium sp. ON_d1]GEJ45569.1 hypothetical protein CRS_21770 [Chryseobacterium sp. ON_d1]